VKIIVGTSQNTETAISKSVRILKAGGVVCYPTETYYALGIDPWNAEARERLYRIKGRAAEKELPCIAADLPMIARRCDVSDPRVTALAAKFWPGPLTLVLPMLDGSGSLAVRISSHPLARSISAQMQSPVVSTSANLSGEPAMREPAQLLPSIRSGIDLLIDSGTTPGGKASTILSLLSHPAEVIREGAIAREDLEAFL